MLRCCSVVVRAGAVVTLFGLAGCVGAPAPAPYGYAAPPGYAPPPYAPPPGAPQAGTYAPQAGSYAPQDPAQNQVAYGFTCSAGVYTCTLPQQIPLGSPCSCPGIGAPSYGVVR